MTTGSISIEDNIITIIIPTMELRWVEKFNGLKVLEQKYELRTIKNHVVEAVLCEWYPVETVREEMK